ncbi:MAG: N-acetylmuramoyl-L-alanine amidase [bacterium]|nr:N-acetylmuramoyl-L-alanine amidase [bacterium]
MKKTLVFLLIFSLSILGKFVFAKEPSIIIVYPKTNPAKIYGTSTFFIGKANPKKDFYINGEKITLSKNGSFAYYIKNLKPQKNTFVMVSGKEQLTFDLISYTPNKNIKAKKLIEFEKTPYITKTDNATLRKTPVDAGINRLAQLPKGTKVFVNGENGNFARIYLNENTNGWILKRELKQLEETNINYADFLAYNFREDNEYYYYEVELSSIVPYSISQNETISVNLFNINNLENNHHSINTPCQKFMGYDSYFEENKFILKIRKPTIPEKKLNGITILVDAGHGGSELGAIGCGGIKEKDFNLRMAKLVQKELKKRGATVIMTREEDIQISLNDRIKMAKDNNAVISLSLHSNAVPDYKNPLENQGASVYYYQNQAKPLAEAILNELTAKTKLSNDKVRQGSLALTRPTSAVSVLVEIGYMINPNDYDMLIKKRFQKKCAKAIVRGVENYLTSN